MDSSLPTTSPAERASRQRTRRFTATLALIALLSIPELLVIFLQRAAHESPLHRGDTIPQLTLKGLDSDSLSFADLRGRRVALLFFNVACAHCQRELFSVNRLSSLFEGSIVIVAISLGDLLNTRYLLRSNQSTLCTLIDDHGEARRAFGIEEVPTLILVNGDQTIEKQIVGEESYHALRKQLTAFAGGSPQAEGKNPQE